MSWHAESELLERYARGELDQVRSFSLEAHLLACPGCRREIANLADGDRLDRVWAEVQEIVDAPRRRPIEALLVGLRTPDHLARLLGATPSLTLSWLTAIALSLAFAVVAAHEGPRGLLVFLALAPLLPVAGVAAAYGRGLDPTYEIGLASPLRGFRLLLIRSAAVLATTTVLAGAAALALPELDWRAGAWLLPALALTLLSLALASFVSPVWAFGSVAFSWLVLVTGTAASESDRFAAFGSSAQVAFALVAVGAGLVVAHRRDAFELGRPA